MDLLHATRMRSLLSLSLSLSLSLFLYDAHTRTRLRLRLYVYIRIYEHRPLEIHGLVRETVNAWRKANTYLGKFSQDLLIIFFSPSSVSDEEEQS